MFETTEVSNTNIYYSRYDWLALPHNVEVSPNEAVVRASTKLISSGHIMKIPLPHRSSSP